MGGGGCREPHPTHTAPWVGSRHCQQTTGTSEGEGFTARAGPACDGVVELETALHHRLLEVDLGAVEKQVGFSVHRERDGGFIAELEQFVFFFRGLYKIHEVRKPGTTTAANTDAQHRIRGLSLPAEDADPLDGSFGHRDGHELIVFVLGLVVVDRGLDGIFCEH